MCLVMLMVYMRKRQIFLGKNEALLSWLAIFFLFFYDFISHLFGDYANINMWKPDFKAWNSVKNNCGRFVKNQMQWPLC